MHCGEVLNTFPAIAPVQEAVDAAFTKSYGREQQKISDAMRLAEQQDRCVVSVATRTSHSEAQWEVRARG